MSKKPDSDIQKEVRAFALKYGLFGLMTALPTTPKFASRWRSICVSNVSAPRGMTG